MHTVPPFACVLLFWFCRIPDKIPDKSVVIYDLTSCSVVVSKEPRFLFEVTRYSYACMIA